MEFIAESSERLDRFLAQRLPEHSRTKLAKLIEAGEVTVDGSPQKP
ncbi:RluA family pseudouridine synthase, partial [bacterium]